MAISGEGIKIHVEKAMAAVKSIGISKRKAKKVLRNLLELYNNEWELIEEDGYRVLFDAIFESPDSEEEEHGNETQRNDLQQEPIRTRSHVRTDHQSSDTALQTETTKSPRLKEPVFPQAYVREREIVLERDPKPICFKKLKTQPQTDPSLYPTITSQEPKRGGLVQMNGFHSSELVPYCSGSSDQVAKFSGNSYVNKIKVPVSYRHNALCKPKQEKMHDYLELEFERPIAVIHPPNHSKAHPIAERGPSVSFRNDYSQPKEALVSLASEEEDGVPDVACNDRSLELVSIKTSSSAFNYEIASTSGGEVKLSLFCNYTLTDLPIASLDALLKLVEDRCLKSYKSLEPKFSLMKLMNDFCQCFLELSTDSIDKQRRHINVASNIDFLRSNIRDVLGSKSKNVCVQGTDMPATASSNAIIASNGPLDSRHNTHKIVPHVPKLLALNDPSGPIKSGMDSKYRGHLNCERSKKKKKLESTKMPNSHVLFDGVRSLHDVNDISKGEERVRISVVNEVNSERYPPYFHYIPENTVYQNAYLNFSLARSGDEDCCSCFGDCLSSPIPCACARETGGEFAYTQGGLIKKEFLDEAISMNHEPQKHNFFYCKDCALERTKNELNPDPCKGHLVRKFIKECWKKCGCHKQCGNRVVQRGVTCNLQVFYISEGKGWGLRTIEELPRGAFVCEYVGEVLTNTELYNRNTQKTGKERHTYPVLLDADWGSEGVLKDDEALCLDATHYGNVARFINHRCSDASLVEIPVEVEVPDHHYYHLAFFTTRNVEAFEELTWDYGIDFDDLNHPVKAFKCLCGSKLCRGVKHSNRAKAGTLTLNGKHHR